MTQTADTVGDVMLRDIIAHPTDIGLRRIFSDWLTDREDRQSRHWAEIIRYPTPIRLVPSGEDWTWHHDDKVHHRGDGYRKLCIARTLLRTSSLTLSLWKVNAVEYRHGFIEVIKAPFDVLVKNLTQWVTEYPLTTVEVSDREPWHSDDEADDWGWWENGESEPQTVINHPALFEEMWKKVHPDDRHGDDIGRWMFYFDSAEAIKALSDTLLDMARRGTL